MEICPNEYFQEKYYKVSHAALSDLNRKTPTEGLIRFLNGLNDFVYGVFLSNEDMSGSETIHLMYAEYTKEFSCFILPIPLDYPQTDELITVFAREINILNTERDFFDTFNTFQHQRESVLEALGHFTFDPSTSPSGTLITVGRKIVPIRKLDRVWFYENQFKDVTHESLKFRDEENCIYLMVDDTNGMIKIGRSKNPKYREGTLQSKEPKTHIIAYWRAPKSIENELHRMFRHKRVRGEWFRLTISDLDEIKFHMESVCKSDLFCHGSVAE